MLDPLQRKFIMKRLKNYYQIRLLVIIFLTIIIISLPKIVIGKQLNIDLTLKEITQGLRCMTCQNQTIYESDSEFAKQIKNEILIQLKEHQTKEQIMNFMETRYGEYILLKPKFDRKNLILWLFPFTLLILSLTLLLIKVKKTR